MDIRQLNLRDLTPDLAVPGAGELHVWIVSSETMSNMHKSMRDYSHFLLFKMLSQYTGIPEGNLELTTGKHGKPSLKQDAPTLHFNLSHCDGLAAFAFSSLAPVGIDIERIDRKAAMDRIARRVFLPSEAAMLEGLEGDEKKYQFFRLWTRTESFLKGIGTGLSSSFTEEEIQKEYARWDIRYPEAPKGAVCCVAYPAPQSVHSARLHPPVK